MGVCMPDAAHSATSYHCQCNPGRTGADCSNRAVVQARSGVVVSSVIAIAIATFVVGLCCIPLAKDYFERRQITKYIQIIRGEGQVRRLASIPTKNMAGDYGGPLTLGS